MTTNDELKAIQKSLQKDADLPPVPDLSETVRTLGTVATELQRANQQVLKLTEKTFAIQELTESLTASLGLLESAEQVLIDNVNEYLSKLKKA